MCSDAPQDLHCSLFGLEAEEIVELTQVRQLTLHFLVLSLHGLRRLFIWAKLIDTARVLLGTACTDGTVAIALGLPFPTSDTGSQGHCPLRFLR